MFFLLQASRKWDFVGGVLIDIITHNIEGGRTEEALEWRMM